MKSKLVLGLTGNFGSGKSTALEYFADMGASVISSDQIVRDLLEHDYGIKNSMTDLFGNEILGADGKIDRQAVADRVFQDERLLHKLNDLLHPLVFRTAEQLMQKTAAGVIVWEVPLLFESGADKKCDYTLTLVSQDDIAARRLATDRSITANDFRQRKKRQMSPEEQKSLSDFVIYNDNTKEELKKSCEEIFNTLQQQLKESNQ